ncbi:MAG TPA: DinB family protein [Phycisphaerae bacterium]|nr:DinB family protein [Phycisphaerae bacterium]
MSRAAVEAYAAGAGYVREAIAGLGADDFRAVPVAGTWSIGQIVIHLMDSDLIASDRMKRVIAEENPTLVGFDEAAFARNLFYEKQDPQVAAEIFRMNRELTAVVLRSVPESAFKRVGTHNERGCVTLGGLVELYVGHLNHHLGFIRHKRQLLGKPL